MLSSLRRLLSRPRWTRAVFDDGEFTYDDHDGMLRDVRYYTLNHSAE